MPRRCSLLLGLVLVSVFLDFAAYASQSSQTAQDIWYSVYFQGLHSGYSHIQSVPDKYNGLPASRDDSLTVTKIIVFGTLVEQDVVSQSWSNPKTGAPYYQTFKIESGGTQTIVDATFTPSTVTAVLKSGTDVTTKVVPIPPGEKIVDGDTEGMDSTGPLKMGDTETDLDFDPLTLTLEKQVSKVVKVDVPVLDSFDSHRHLTAEIDVQDPEGSATAFQNADGVPIRILMPAGICMVRCSQGNALAADSSLAALASDPTAAPFDAESNRYQPAPDLAVSTSVSPLGRSMGDERTLNSLTVRLTVEGQPSKTVTESSIAVPPADADPVNSLSSSKTSRFLADAPYLSLDSPVIRSTVSQIVGTQTDSYKIVQAIHDWVYGHMSPKGSLGVPRSASDIIANPVGVCRDYAILYTSLARAAGIPTKVDAGLVGYQGKFYYHAWATSYVGGSVGWLPVDATMPSMFVDASHIPLGSGDPTVMFALADVIGNMHVETLKAENSL